MKAGLNKWRVQMIVKAYNKEMFPEYIGTVRMWGDPCFDSDTIRNDGEKQWRWLSYPLSRLVINPKEKCNLQEYMPMQKDLDLIIGYYIGDKSVMPFYRRNHCMVKMVDSQLETVKARSVQTIWHPYKIDFIADYGNTLIRGYDFFKDTDTIMRVFEVNNAGGKTITLGGLTEEGGCTLRDDIIVIETEHYCYAISIVVLTEQGDSQGFLGSIEVENNNWKISIPIKNDFCKIVYCYGFATKKERAEVAIERVKDGFSNNISATLYLTKKVWDELLGRVPMPQQWGISHVDSQDVTQNLHRRNYYGAWAFIISNSIMETPERDFNYRQLTLGKGALYQYGNPICPCNCAWESFFEIQLLAYIDPETAWSSLEGFMYMVDDDGYLNGECLPSQKAHTAWIVYNLDKDVNRLKSIYPALRRYLLWRGKNPRWMWDTYSNPYEKDSSFVSQWYRDVGYVINICRELGNKEDIAMWEEKQQQMIEHMKKWFYETDKIYNFYFENTSLHSSEYRSGSEPEELYVCENLVNEYPTDMEERLVQYYKDIHKPELELVGFPWMKYGSGVNIACGLLEKGLYKEAMEFIDSCLRHALSCYDFCEILKPDSYDVNGVNPSSFNANLIIDFTWLKNGMRYEKGLPFEYE
jgi:hypothetical protein